ncbi:MAG: DegT/DnrJ/EryC1/StrS family aminotransferase [Chlamydiales bacterium]|nr:DegT/DnrJ/EryC1/StrS family aminotransferase [Chlamydiales bacterium]
MHIPVYKPYFCGRERVYVNECLDSTWISSKGVFIERFEEQFRKFVDARYAASVCNGTVALHLALLALGIGPGDEVIVPTLTYVASVNAISYVGATPVFVDSRASDWQIDPEDVKRKITSKTRGIIAVHLYGHPCDLDALKEIADEHGLFLVEDCAEAFGTFFKGCHVGSHADMSTYSFFGNKTITTGEGGMVTTNDEALFQKIAMLKNQGNSRARTYWHEMVGYNYRMTNLAAAVGLAQIEKAAEILRKKRALAAAYAEKLKGLPLLLHAESPDCLHSYWMISILVEERGLRDPLRDFLAAQEIETRPFFHPIHKLPMYEGGGKQFPVAEDLSSRGINLPSFPELSTQEMEYICAQIKSFYSQTRSSFLVAAATHEA